MILRDFYETSSDTDDTGFVISEDLSEAEKKEIDGKSILAKVVGPMFVPGGNSLNKRHYTKELWEHVLAMPTIKKRLADRTMYGGIGHDDRPVSEEDLRTGKTSHIITNLWIDEKNRGMGEALVLGTPVGQNLFTYLKAKSKLKVSTRANGKFEDRKTPEGVPIVDKNNYILETVDFVIRPGFPQTDPQLKEDLNSDLNTMDPLTESLMKSRDSLQLQFVEATSANKVLEKTIAEQLQTIKGLQERADKSIVLPDGFMKWLEALGVDSVNGLIKFVENMDPLALHAVRTHELSGVDIEAYVELGTPDEINTVSTDAIELIGEYKSVGADEGETVSPAELQEAIDSAHEALTKYSELGTISELQEMKDRLDELEEEMGEKERSDAATKLSNKFKVDVKIVESLLEKFGPDQADEVEDVLKTMTGRNPKPVKPTGRVEEKDNSGENSDDDTIRPARRAAGRFFESLRPGGVKLSAAGV